MASITQIHDHKPMWKDLLAGYMGGCAQCLAGQPFDIAKVRLQNPATARFYNGTLDCFRKIFMEEGMMGFYKGTLSPLIGNAFMCSAVFTMNEMAKKHFRNQSHDPINYRLTYTEHYLAGLFAGIGFGFFAGPTEHIRIKMQMQKDNPIYSSSIDCAKKIYGRHGIRGIFHGTAATIMRDSPLHAVYFMVYNYLKDHLSPATVAPGDENMAVVLFSGGICGMVTWSLHFPMDVVKSLIQADNLDKPKYSGWIDAFKKNLARPGGFKNFFNGYGPCQLRGFPANAATFVAFEATSKMIGGKAL